jgi:hypothetical protein
MCKGVQRPTDLFDCVEWIVPFMVRIGAPPKSRHEAGAWRAVCMLLKKGNHPSLVEKLRLAMRQALQGVNFNVKEFLASFVLTTAIALLPEPPLEVPAAAQSAGGPQG